MGTGPQIVGAKKTNFVTFRKVVSLFHRFPTKERGGSRGNGWKYD